MKMDTEDTEDEGGDNMKIHTTQPFTGKTREGHIFENGLLLKTYNIGNVTYTDINVEQQTRWEFLKSGHPLLDKHPLPVPCSWIFEYGEHVINIKDKKEQVGQTIEWVKETRCLLKHETVEGLSKIWVEKVNLRKRFKYCDTVAVTGGEATDVTGVIVTVTKDCCTIVGLQANQMANMRDLEADNLMDNLIEYMCRNTQFTSTIARS
ncbi:hypothetical protein D9758_017070 [Tetrapyrgos nigripes]|uniref:Uncharacterized protein n=1 Tax=Tetrapyrgos nigripes TaxID=182062 RepID=A0A8H5CHD8_9AGAR|nr:hypothetical protein D9758_017070 [Tetrapyrgos nigripes]